MTETSVKVIITYIRVEEVTLNNSLKDKTSMTLRLKGIKKLKFSNRYIFAIFNISNLENGLKIYGLKKSEFVAASIFLLHLIKSLSCPM